MYSLPIGPQLIQSPLPILIPSSRLLFLPTSSSHSKHVLLLSFKSLSPQNFVFSPSFSPSLLPSLHLSLPRYNSIALTSLTLYEVSIPVQLIMPPHIHTALGDSAAQQPTKSDLSDALVGNIRLLLMVEAIQGI